MYYRIDNGIKDQVKTKLSDEELIADKASLGHTTSISNHSQSIKIIILLLCVLTSQTC